jgi:hypothetical protein
VLLRAISSQGLHAVGDDRDQILVRYGPGGPRPDLIQTGSGGNPFTQSGWTGWSALDAGFAVGRGSITVAPCSQVGVLGLTVNGIATEPPIEQCATETDLAVVPTRALSAGASLHLSSEDNRAVTPLNPSGALIDLTVPLGEPRSVSATGNDQVKFTPSGFPLCHADLEAQVVQCDGLVPGGRYALTRRRRHAVRRGTADSGGTISVGFPGRRGIAGGDELTLTDRARRRLTTLHVAHLKVDIQGGSIRSGRCQPGDYYGSPPPGVPTSPAVGQGISGTGTICPASGDASGLPTDSIEQIDDFSGGTTSTAVPELHVASPLPGETLYGPFLALAQTGGSAGSTVGLTITRAGSRRVVLRVRKANTVRGVAVRGLAPGAYTIKWVLTDAAGDTRTVRTGFVEQR